MSVLFRDHDSPGQTRPQPSAHRTLLLDVGVFLYFCIFFSEVVSETKPGAETAAAAGRPRRHIGTPAIVPNQAGWSAGLQATATMSSSSTPHDVGRALIAAFEHVLVISLSRSLERRQHVGRELGRFDLHRNTDFDFVDAADCRAYGRWAFLPELQEGAPRKHNESGRQIVPWMRKPCNGTWHPSCSDQEHRHCMRRRMKPDLAATRCGEICYSISVVLALRQFLASNRSRVLLLEDDICATPYLHNAHSMLTSIAAHRRWNMVKMGHCFLDEGARGGGNITEPACATSADIGTPRVHGNHIFNSLGNSYCAHALGLTRQGAQTLLRLGFPVSAVFDDVLAVLGGRMGPRHQSQALRAAGLRSASELGAIHFKHSLFGQLSRQAGATAGGPRAFASTINADAQRWGR